MIEQIKNLYRKYSAELIETIKYQKILYSSRDFWPQFDDLESEITYLRIREYKPRIIVEISPCRGWSTSWILKAIKDNKSGYLHSYDMIDYSKRNIPNEYFKFWELHVGDVCKKIIPNMDYLFIDSEHTLAFANWYIKNFLEKYSNIPVSIHDVFHIEDPNGFSLEGGRIIKWLKEKNIEYITASPNKSIDNYNAIIDVRKEIGINDTIHHCNSNPCIFFNI
jgi:hypothetical protein